MTQTGDREKAVVVELRVRIKPLIELKLRKLAFASPFKHSDQLLVDDFIPSNDVTFLENVVAAVTIGNEAAGFAYHDQSRRQVPRFEVSFPTTVDPSSRDPGEIKGGCAETAQASNVLLHRAHFFPRKSDIPVAMMR